jgi:hypothetical protein
MPILDDITINQPFADLASLKALDTTTVNDNVLVFVKTLGLYRLNSISSATPDDVYIIQPNVGPGRWIRIALPTQPVGESGMVGGANSIPILTFDTGQVTAISSVIPNPNFHDISDISYTLVLGDQNGYLALNNGTTTTVTIPKNGLVPFPVGTKIGIINNSLSAIITPGTDVTLVGGEFSFIGANTYCFIQQTSADIWEIVNPSDLSFWSAQVITASQNLGYSDQFNKQFYDSVSNGTITIQPFLSVPIQIGATIEYTQTSTGKIIFAAGAGVTILSNASPSALFTTNPGDKAFLTHSDTNTWTLLIVSGMAAQAPTEVVITGGAIDGTTIGENVSTTGKFSSLSVKQPVGFSASNSVQQVSGVQTTNATPTVLVSILLNEAETITLNGSITAAQSNHSNAVGGTFCITARRATAGNVTLIGSVVTNVQSSSAATFTCAVDTGTQTVRVLVTGVAATTYNWAANYNYQLVLTNI